LRPTTCSDLARSCTYGVMSGESAIASEYACRMCLTHSAQRVRHTPTQDTQRGSEGETRARVRRQPLQKPRRGACSRMHLLPAAVNGHARSRAGRGELARLHGVVVLVAVGAREPDVIEAICEMGPAESRGCRLPRPARSIPRRKGCCERLQVRFAAFATMVSKRMLSSGRRFFSVLYNSGGGAAWRRSARASSQTSRSAPELLSAYCTARRAQRGGGRNVTIALSQRPGTLHLSPSISIYLHLSPSISIYLHLLESLWGN